MAVCRYIDTALMLVKKEQWTVLLDPARNTPVEALTGFQWNTVFKSTKPLTAWMSSSDPAIRLRKVKSNFLISRT